MTGPTSAVVVTTSGTAALLMVFTSLGVPPTLLLAGGMSFWAACCARTGLALIKNLNGSAPFSMEFFARQIAILMCCIPLAAVASCIVFLAARVCKADIEADAAALCGFLIIMGLRGSEGFQWIADTSANIFMKFVPGQKPSGGNP